jgi:hypothetical protein
MSAIRSSQLINAPPITIINVTFSSVDMVYFSHRQIVVLPPRLLDMLVLEHRQRA